MSPERLSRKRIRQDNFVTTAFKASEYIQKNKTFFLGGFAALIAIILIFTYLNYSKNQKIAEAETMFGKAQLASAMGQQALAINDYKVVIQDYSSTPIADRACYYLARTFYDRDEIDSALVYYEKYIDKFGNEPLLLAAAYAGAAECYELHGDLAKAGEYYMNAGETANNEFVSPEYFMSAGRAFRKAGIYDNAEKAYQMVVDNYSRTAQGSLAKKFLAEVQYAKSDS